MVAIAGEKWMVIASCIDGRLRVRDELLRNAAAADAVRRVLLAAPGVRQVSANPRAGSLLIIYQQAQTTLRKITDLLNRYLLPESSVPASLTERSPTERRSHDRRIGPPTRRSELFPRIRRQAVNLGMLAALLVSMAGAVLGAKMLHIVAGVVFLGVLAIHLFEKRRSLLV
jgi:hypothetical protein